jgi:hypothetical protein
MKIAEYFRLLEEEVSSIYALAKEARKVGVDPDFEPEIPLAVDLAGRVESLGLNRNSWRNSQELQPI